jgi:hypothetical protein
VHVTACHDTEVKVARVNVTADVCRTGSSVSSRAVLDEDADRGSPYFPDTHLSLTEEQVKVCSALLVCCLDSNTLIGLIYTE